MNEHENNPLNSSQSDFGLPGGYFQHSALAIANKIEWQEEHKQFPLLLQHKGVNGFSVPAGYFNRSEARLELLDLEQLSALPKHNSFAVPEQYFAEAELQSLGSGLGSETQELAGLKILNALPKRHPFKTPEGYFAAQAQQVNTLLAKDARVIRLRPSRAWYAAAALLMLALGFWAYNAYFKPVETGDCGTIACLDKQELINAKTLENLENEELYELVNSKKLEEKLNNSSDKKEKITTDSSAKQDAVDDLPDGI